MDKQKKPLRIQLKIQISLIIAIIIGFIAVTSIAYVVLNNIAKETTISTIEMTIKDVKDNLVADVNNDLMIGTGKVMMARKATVSSGGIAFPNNYQYVEEADFPASGKIGYTNYQDYIKEVKKRFKNEVQTIYYGYITPPTDATYIGKDGTIKMTTDSYIETLTNISELNVGRLEFEEYISTSPAELILPYQYVEQKGENLKIIFRQYDLNYYFMVTYNEQAYQKQIKTSIQKGLATRHIGENGYVIVADSEKNVLSTPTTKIGEKIDINLSNKNNLSIFNLDKDVYYSYIMDFEGVNIVGLMNKAECDRSTNTALKITILAELVVFLVLYFIIYFVIARNVIKPLKRVNNSLSIITSGNLEEKVRENNSREIKALSDDINLTVESLKEHMGKEAKLIQDELVFAKEIQHSVLPSTFPNNREFDIYADMITAKEVGGDFYDFYLIDDRHLCVLIADVSGKGIPASLFMMQAKTVIKSLVESKIPLDKAITKANKKLYENNIAQMFVTVWCGIIDLDSGVMQFVNGGHNPPLLKHENTFTYLKSKANIILAVMEDAKYTIQEVKLNKGDELYLYTDGVTEATSINTELFGEKRLLDILNSYPNCSAKERCDKVLDNVKEFTLNAEQSDDITMLDIKYLGK